MQVHVVGNVCVDTTFRLGRFPLPGETLNAAGYADGVGGKGANQAVAAARAGAAVRLWAALGDDPAGAWVRSNLADDLDLSRLVVKPLPTDRSAILVDATGENLIVTGSLCAAAFDPLADTQLAEHIGAGDILVMQGNLSACATLACLQAARRRGCATLLNPSPLPADTHFSLSDVDIVVVNEGEAKAMTGMADHGRAARELCRHGPRLAVITLGARGCFVLDGPTGEGMAFAAPPVVAVDSSGAGDVFCGVLAGGIGQGMAVPAAVRLAVNAAALSVGRPGTLASCPTRREIIELRTQLEPQNA